MIMLFLLLSIFQVSLKFYSVHSSSSRTMASSRTVICIAILMNFVLSSFSVGLVDNEISLNGKGYIKYDSRWQPYSLNANKINIQFKTTHPTGTLVYLAGQEGDTIVLQLIQGKLR